LDRSRRVNTDPGAFTDRNAGCHGGTVRRSDADCHSNPWGNPNAYSYRKPDANALAGPFDLLDRL